MSIRPDTCPCCLSRFLEIHGMIYPNGCAYLAEPCRDTWHKGAKYNPSELILTEEDKRFLAEQKIGF